MTNFYTLVNTSIFTKHCSLFCYFHRNNLNSDISYRKLSLLSGFLLSINMLMNSIIRDFFCLPKIICLNPFLLFYISFPFSTPKSLNIFQVLVSKFFNNNSSPYPIFPILSFFKFFKLFLVINYLFPFYSLPVFFLIFSCCYVSLSILFCSILFLKWTKLNTLLLTILILLQTSLLSIS